MTIPCPARREQKKRIRSSKERAVLPPWDAGKKGVEDNLPPPRGKKKKRGSSLTPTVKATLVVGAREQDKERKKEG